VATIVATSICDVVWRIGRASKLAMKRLAASMAQYESFIGIRMNRLLEFAVAK